MEPKDNSAQKANQEHPSRHADFGAGERLPAPGGLAMILHLREFKIHFPRPALVMGILNVTPDSFSDGGRFLEPGAAVAHGLEMVAQGAEIIDVGGESSRPGAIAVSEAEELHRVLPVIKKLAEQVTVPISIDTRKPAVARAAIDAGASLVNDIATNRDADTMSPLIAETGAGYVVMHMQGAPENMQRKPSYTDVVAEVGGFFERCLLRLKNAGVEADQVILDVGIGFGKTLEHNLELIRGLNCFRKYRRPLLLGVSRKSFIGKLLGPDTPARLPAGLACACWAIQAGANLIRTHDVGETVQALRMTEAILARQWYGMAQTD